MTEQQQAKRGQWLSLFVPMSIALIAGATGAIFTLGAMDVYQSAEKPFFAPPAWVYSAMWMALYLLAAFSMWLVFDKNRPHRVQQAAAYALQLAACLVWSWLFFVRGVWGLAFVWLVLLWALVTVMMRLFRRASSLACWLNAPCAMWIAFLCVVNFFIARLNP